MVQGHNVAHVVAEDGHADACGVRSQVEQVQQMRHEASLLPVLVTFNAAGTVQEEVQLGCLASAPCTGKCVVHVGRLVDEGGGGGGRDGRVDG